VLLARFVEPKLHKKEHQVRWGSTLVNFVLFVSPAIPFLYYFRAEEGWSTWVTDLLGGVAVAPLLTFVQSLHWSGPRSHMRLRGCDGRLHPVVMFGLRLIVRLEG
jgi:hypothetical protein